MALPNFKSTWLGTISTSLVIAGISCSALEAVYGHKEIVELLIAKGADVNAKIEDGGTPLDYADGEIADLLRKHGGKTKKELEAAGK